MLRCSPRSRWPSLTWEQPSAVVSSKQVETAIVQGLYIVAGPPDRNEKVRFCTDRRPVASVKSSTNTPVMQGAKQIHIERRCDYELPRQSCRLGRACVDIFSLRSFFGFVWNFRAKEVRREVGFVMPK